MGEQREPPSDELRRALRIANSPTPEAARHTLDTSAVDPRLIRDDGGGTIEPRRADFGPPDSFDPRIRWSPMRQLRWALAAVALYVGVAFMRYALAHPELTDTERFLDFWKVVTWQ